MKKAKTKKPLLSEQVLREWFQHSDDVLIQPQSANDGDNEPSAMIIFIESMCDKQYLQQKIIPDINRFLLQGHEQDAFEKNTLFEELEQNLELEQLKKKIMTSVFSGKLLIWLPQSQKIYLADLADPPKRSPEESKTEISIRGPRDAFVEEIDTNIALMRKRIRSESLHFKQFNIGSHSETKAGVLYLADIADENVINLVLDRMQRIETDTLYTHIQLEELISEERYSIFPIFDVTTRPDFVLENLYNGRFAIFIDGNPTASLGPTNLLLHLKAPEDSHFPSFFVSFERIIRIIGILISMFLPGFWIALTTFHQDQIPFTLLATTAISRQGIPFPTAIELFVMLLLFELFREAGIRLPSIVGQTLAVVGGLIIGDAAIRAGLTSATMLVIAATTAVATFTLVSQSMSGAVSIIRVTVLILSSILGMFGFLISVFAVTTYLASLRSFGISYLGPVSIYDFNLKQWWASIIRKHWSLRKGTWLRTNAQKQNPRRAKRGKRS